LGASVGANAHSSLRVHIAAAFRAGLTSTQVHAALKMAEHVKHRAGEITTEKATRRRGEQRIPARTEFCRVGSSYGRFAVPNPDAM